MAGSWALVGFEPLSTLTFKPPRPFEAGVHGPSAAGSSYSYPPPSTIAGVLAGLAFRAGACTPGKGGGGAFEDARACLAALLGDGFKLRPGLALYRGGLYAYIGTRRLVKLERLHEALSAVPLGATGAEAAEAFGEALSRLGEGDWLEVGAAARYGVGLQRDSKTVATGLLYRLERIAYPPGAAVTVYVYHVKHSLGLVAVPVKMGSKQGVMAARTLAPPLNAGTPANALARGSGEHWTLALLTPALIDPDTGETPPVSEGVVTANDEEWARSLARRLLGTRCTEACEDLCDAKILVVPRNEWSLTVQTTGWSVAEGRHRKPMLLVPPGTLIRVHAKKECILEIAENGIGDHADLGWGTVAAAPARAG